MRVSRWVIAVVECLFGHQDLPVTPGAANCAASAAMADSMAARPAIKLLGSARPRNRRGGDAPREKTAAEASSQASAAATGSPNTLATSRPL